MSVKRRCDCGAYYDFEFGETHVCKYCGTRHVITFNEDTFERIKQANSFRVDGNFQKSIEIYNELIEKHPKSSELRFGRFLAKYNVTDTEALQPDRILTINQTSVYDDEDYLKAVEFDLYKKEEYERIAQIVESRREINRKINDCICKNEYCSILISANCEETSSADELFEELGICFDVFYPTQTIQSLPNEDKLAATFLACDKVRTLYVVVDDDCEVDKETERVVDRFLKTHKKGFFVVVTNDEDKCAELVSKASKVIAIDDQCLAQVVDDMMYKVIDGFRGIKEFHSKGQKVKDEDNPSPEIRI